MSPILYLKLSCNQMHLSLLPNGRELRLQADPPFSNQRLLVADFSAAQQLLRRGLAELLPRRFLRLSLPPQLLIQPLEYLEGGLAQAVWAAFDAWGQGALARDEAGLRATDPQALEGLRQVMLMLFETAHTAPALLLAETLHRDWRVCGY